MMLGLSSCEDDFPHGEIIVGEGESLVTATVQFQPLVTSLEKDSRATPGDVMTDISSLTVVIYDNEEHYYRHYNLGVSDLSRLEDNSGVPSDWGDDDKKAENTTRRYRLTIPEALPFGRYYMYVVANLGRELLAEEMATPDALRKIETTWQSNRVASNNQMFGYLCAGDTGTSSASDDGVYRAPLLTVSRSQTVLSAWLRRLASKVTLCFDGSGLKENVFVYIHKATIRQIPRTCRLGESNPAGGSAENDTVNYIAGESIYYEASGQALGKDNYPASNQYANWLEINRTTPVRGAVSTDASGNVISSHGEKDLALYFYENMQGNYADLPESERKRYDKRQDPASVGNNFISVKPGDPDYKDNVPCGTYIEVEGYYINNNSSEISSGKIKYRFMLGCDISYDYNSERNRHYKLTMSFKGKANQVDWHIEYIEQILEVTKPKVFNYQGLVFVRDNTKLNLGHTFTAGNPVTVSSYEGSNDPVNFREFTVSFREKGQSEFTDKCDWLHWSVVEGAGKGAEKVIKFTADTAYVEIDIDARLSNAKLTTSENQPHNLAGQGSTLNGYNIGCTANCYMVGATGWYMFPLVYGNAIHNGSTNKDAYEYSGSLSGRNVLKKFKNHLNNDITSPYIRDNKDCVPASATLVWQDEPNLIQTASIKYDATLYGGKGGIKFHTGDIKQGNAVIAIKDNAGRIMWSWQIWVTRFDFEESDRNISVTGFNGAGPYDLMPVNLGWCSGHGEKIRYYKERQCEVKFTSGHREKTITIVQKSHIALPRGNNPYYQWGRKDPFVARLTVGDNKLRYDANGVVSWTDPERLTPDTDDANAVNRPLTRDALYQLIQHPDLWHNPPRKRNPGLDDPTLSEAEKASLNPWVSKDSIYVNMWKGAPAQAPVESKNSRFEAVKEPVAPTYHKTVYDPCPVGYQVPVINAFTGFTVSGDNIAPNADEHWFHVRREDIPAGNHKESLSEFYTDTTKVQSIVFPETGYRDWDAKAGAFYPGIIGYIWSADLDNGNDNSAFNFMFSRTYGYVYPKNAFYPCDGFSVRPCYYGKHLPEWVTQK